MTWFLKTKAWVLFTALVTAPLILESALILTAISLRSFHFFFDSTVILLNLMFVFSFLWFYAIGTKLVKITGLKGLTGLKFFKISSLALLIIIQILFTLTLVFSNINISQGSFKQIIEFFDFAFFFLSILSLFCFCYSLLHVALILKGLDLNKNATFFEIASILFLILILPISIWKIQPKINLIIEEYSQAK